MFHWILGFRNNSYLTKRAKCFQVVFTLAWAPISTWIWAPHSSCLAHGAFSGRPSPALSPCSNAAQPLTATWAQYWSPDAWTPCSSPTVRKTPPTPVAPRTTSSRDACAQCVVASRFYSRHFRSERCCRRSLTGSPKEGKRRSQKWFK